jgi:ATP-dependent DNA ligase
VPWCRSDGYRILAYKDGPRVRLLSRHGVDHGHRYPPSALVLDGELAVFDQQLRSRFD